MKTIKNIVVINFQTIRKLLIIFITIMLLGASCNKDYLEDVTGEWYIKNSTYQTLILHLPHSLFPWFNVEIGDSLLIGDCTKYYTNSPNFDFWYHIAIYPNNKDIKHLEVFSKDSVLLKTWDYLDNGLLGKQLFDESSWQYYQRPFNNTNKDGTYTYMRSIWVFDIMPEDIIKKDD